MKSASERVGRFVEGKTFNDYLSDELLRSGVERQFEIIGEAMTRLMKLDETVAERITEYRKISGFRNALIHGYDSIDDETSWGIIEGKLPLLRVELDALLKT
ncbi:MAG TPA: HepT-like ribonuclease domain-containing protein [Tepidisphaeraceae bacterium]|nr:HepT-like ribonuclease domain-containing protein [Tepidisphaeraceae bacterium]